MVFCFVRAGVSSVVEQVASVLDALSDAEDAVRQRVISLVERLTLKIDQGNVECQKLQDENLALRSFLAQLQEENMKLFYDYSLLKYQLDYKVSACILDIIFIVVYISCSLFS